jgi:TolA-binding protein
VASAPAQTSTGRASKEEKKEKQAVHKPNMSNLSANDNTRIQQLEAAIAAIQTKQVDHDQKLQHNTEQLSTLGSSVDQLRGDNSSLMIMMQTMIQKQDDLLAQNRVAGEERRVRPRSAAGDCPSGLE